MILTDEQVLEFHRLVVRLYEKYPAYVHCDICYATNTQIGNTLPPVKTMKLNVYTPLIGHNNFYKFEGFEKFVNKILVDGIENVRIKVLEETISNAKANEETQISVIKEAQKELDKLKGIKL